MQSDAIRDATVVAHRAAPVGRPRAVIDFAAISKSSALGRMLRVLLRVLPGGTAVRVLQGPLRGARWVVGASTHGCWLGSYEREMQKKFAAVLAPGQVVFDIGANVGFYALLAARYVGPSGQVIAFEPNPRNIDYLNRHLHLNHAANVQVIAAAVGDADGVTRFDASLGPCEGRVAPDGALETPIHSLDTLVRDGRVPVPDVVKVDVEGAEVDVLRGARELLTRRRTVLFVATHSTELRDRSIELLREYGYDTQPVDDASSAELVARPR